jgi:hypothetical protein
MEIQNKYQLISQLKQQHRIGATPPPPGPAPTGLENMAGVTEAGAHAIAAGAITALQAVNSLWGSLQNLNKALAISAGYDKQKARIDELNSKYKTVIASSLNLEKANASLNSSFGITSNAAAGLAEKLQKTAYTYGLTSDQVKSYASNIKSMLPLMNQQTTADTKFYTGLQKTQDIVKTNLGLSDEQTNSYTSYAAAQSDSADASLRVAKSVAEAFGDNAQGDLGYFKMITEGIAEAGAEVQLQYGKIPGSLESAVIKSKKFGLSLKNLQSAANNLLNIEASIGQELEYQLLSGHRLVDNSGRSLTNLYREATLRGQANEQADIMNTIIENEGEVLENNLFARQEMSKLLGMDEQQLASAIQKKRILDKAAAEGITIDVNGSNALAQAAAAVEAGALTPEDFESLKKATDTRTTDDRLEQILKVNEEQLFYTKLINQQAIINATRVSAEGNIPDLSGFINTFAELETIGIIDIASKGLKAKRELLTPPIPFAEGGVVPPGYPNDTYPALLSSDETVVPPKSLDTVMNNTGGNEKIQLVIREAAAAIVAAINKQPIFTGGINAPYYG